MEILDVLLATLPYLGAGLVVAIVSRFTGVAMSFLLVPTLLYWGATPLEVVAFMLTFVVYNNFTLETQDMRLDMKNLSFFKGWRLVLPLIVSLILAFIAPPVSVAFFILCFILELGAVVYGKIDDRERPKFSTVMGFAVMATIWAVLGVVLLPWLPSQYFYGLVGLMILVITAIAWYAGAHRSAWRGMWSQLWCFASLFLGAFGLEFTSYIKGLRRSPRSAMDSLFPLIAVIAALFGAVAMYSIHNIFAMPSLMAAVGAALGTRAFGVYEYSKQGSFSYTAIAVAILAAVCLLLVGPVPTGLPNLEGLM
ncbi:hypothetical protein [uncultured Veillonella sp.]|uniref:hypothetical protein n=1 Tax=uncultured Veillonella sp. TaxID=159268 RepID=UPI00260C1D13|nr:hypothetical protein [uncultured Veillonella sp.]